MRQLQLSSSWVLLSGLTLMGCAHGTITPRPSLADTAREAVCPDAVMLYTGAHEIRGATVEPVALLKYTEEARMVNETILLNAVRRKAAKLGATGVLLPTTDLDFEQSRRMAMTQSVAGMEPGVQAVAFFAPADSTRVRLICGNGKRADG